MKPIPDRIPEPPPFLPAPLISNAAHRDGRCGKIQAVETYVRCPREVFRQSQHLNVPLFQRRYVWKQDEQWAPLWDDIRRTAELRMKGAATATHFLGAVVLQVQGSVVGGVPQWSVIDGQQRLTTLQLLMDATAALLEDRGEQKLANRLHKLTHNDEDDVDPDRVLKLRHTNADGPAYQEVMEAPAPVEHETLKHRNDQLIGAHKFFSGQVAEWFARVDAVDPTPAEALVDALVAGLQLVVIALRSDEDSQEIFETLNGRGTPLTAADLIKNLLFQRLAAEGVDGDIAYRDYWRLFESSFWEKEVSVGRFSMPRSALFLGQWLVSRTGEDIGNRAFFSRFKHFVDHDFGRPTLDLIKLLHQQATTYQKWQLRADGKDPDVEQVPLAIYRMDSASLEVAKPLLIWLHEPDDPLPATETATVVGAVESWLMRRMMLRLPTSDLGRTVARIIKNYRGTPSEGLGERIRDELARGATPSSYWPGDDAVRDALRELSVYRSYGRTRLRMMLEAVEDHQRGFTGAKQSKVGTRVPRGKMHIEHVLPQKWRTGWPVDDLAGEIDRDAHVHRLGNLTLLTESLNVSVSNAAWHGAQGKRAAFDRHDVMLMSRQLRDHVGAWTEKDIDARTAHMIDALLATWPVPEGHRGRVDQAPPSSLTMTLKMLVADGSLPPGTILRPRDGSAPATVTADGLVDYCGNLYESPSGAGRAAVGHGVNGWYFWRLPDGRRLVDLRDIAARRRDGPTPPKME